MDEKKKIRKTVLDMRNSLSGDEAVQKSEAIFERLCLLKQYAGANIIHVYMDYRNEVRTGKFIQRCLRDGKRVAVPRVEAGHSLSAYEITDVEKDIIRGFKGIPEPDGPALNKIRPEEIDMVVMPGVAFDRSKHRLGYGGGYYDRFLPLLRPDCVKVGVAYGFQLMEDVPAEEHDAPADIVITEDTIIW